MSDIYKRYIKNRINNSSSAIGIYTQRQDESAFDNFINSKKEIMLKNLDRDRLLILRKDIDSLVESMAEDIVKSVLDIVNNRE